MDNWILTLMTFIPLVGAALVLFLPQEKPNLIKSFSAVVAFIPLLLSVYLFLHFDRSLAGINTESGFQFVVHIPWISIFNIEYFVGVDGLSMPMVLLTTLVSFIAVVASWGINKKVKGYFGLFLLLQAAMTGTFIALDFFLFYVFWELMLLPMYFLIGIWGGPRREYAAIKFFLYTLTGSVLMLLAMIALYFQTGNSFNMLDMMAKAHEFANPGLMIFGFAFAKIIWIALFIGFAIKIPIVPFHTWLPDAHVEAPTAISVILAGVLLKMGTYGILRMNFPMFPEATRYFAYSLAVIGVINILYGALAAMAQKDLKKLVAYSSVSHMGFVVLGMAALTKIGMNGALFQMFNHGTITAMMFLLVGVVYDRAHHREIEGFGGLAVAVPVYAGIFAFAFFAALGLPGLSGFVSEAMVFLGTFGSHQDGFRLLAAIAAIGVVLTAGYVLWMIQRVFLGPLNEKYRDLPEINGRELFTLVPLMAVVLMLGFYPHPVLNLMSTSMNYLVDLVVNF